LHLREEGSVNSHPAVKIHFEWFTVLHDECTPFTMLNMGAGQVAEFPANPD
jgi:hypothetical protein